MGHFQPSPERVKAVFETFDYHKPNEEQAERIARNRQAFKACALVVLQTTAPGSDQTVALRMLHEAMMTANKAIALEEAQLVESKDRGASTWLNEPPPPSIVNFG